MCNLHILPKRSAYFIVGRFFALERDILLFLKLMTYVAKAQA